MKAIRKPNKILNNNGSSLVLTLILIAVVSIMLIGTHTSIVSYAERTKATYYENQAYLVARSVVTAVAQEIEAEGAVEKRRIVAEITAAQELAADNAAAQSPAQPYDPTEEEIQALIEPILIPQNQILKALYNQSVGFTLELSDIAFSNNASFRQGDISANITIKADDDLKTIYNISSTAHVDGKLESVSIELNVAKEDHTITTDTTVVGSGGSGGTGDGSGGSGDGSLATPPAVSFEANTDKIYTNGNFHIDNMSDYLFNDTCIFTTGTITISIKYDDMKPHSNPTGMLVGKKITFDLRDSDKYFHLSKSCFAEEIEIYVENQQKLQEKLYFYQNAPLFTNKITIHLKDEGRTDVYVKGDVIPFCTASGTVDSLGNVLGKVQGLEDQIPYMYSNYKYIEMQSWGSVNARKTYDMRMADIQTQESIRLAKPWPDDYLAIARGESSNAPQPGDGIAYITSNKQYNDLSGLLWDGSIGTTIGGNVPYIVVSSGTTLTLGAIYSANTYIYLEDNARLILNHQQVRANVYFGGPNAAIFWTELNKSPEASTGASGNINSTTNIPSPGGPNLVPGTVTTTFEQYTYTIDKYVRN